GRGDPDPSTHIVEAGGLVVQPGEMLLQVVGGRAGVGEPLARNKGRRNQDPLGQGSGRPLQQFRRALDTPPELVVPNRGPDHVHHTARIDEQDGQSGGPELSSRVGETGHGSQALRRRPSAKASSSLPNSYSSANWSATSDGHPSTSMSQRRRVEASRRLVL